MLGRQALWFAQRAADQEKESVLCQLQGAGWLHVYSAEGIHVHSTCLWASRPFVSIAGIVETASGGIHRTTIVRSEDVLDQLTQRITGKQGLSQPICVQSQARSTCSSRSS